MVFILAIFAAIFLKLDTTIEPGAVPLSCFGRIYMGLAVACVLLGIFLLTASTVMIAIVQTNDAETPEIAVIGFVALLVLVGVVFSICGVILLSWRYEIYFSPCVWKLTEGI